MAYSPDKIAEYIRELNAVVPDGCVLAVQSPNGSVIPLQQMIDTMQANHRHILSLKSYSPSAFEVESSDERGDDRIVDYYRLLVIPEVASAPAIATCHTLTKGTKLCIR